MDLHANAPTVWPPKITQHSFGIRQTSSHAHERTGAVLDWDALYASALRTQINRMVIDSPSALSKLGSIVDFTNRRTPNDRITIDLWVDETSSPERIASVGRIMLLEYDGIRTVVRVPKTIH